MALPDFNVRILAALSASFVFGFIGLLSVPHSARRRCNTFLFAMSLLIAMVLPMTGCSSGGGGGSGKTTTPGTTLGTYNVTITATSGSFSSSVVVPVVVQ
jgi:hypothetical protein